MRDSVIVLTTAFMIASASCVASVAQSAPPPGAAACSGCHAGSDNAMPGLRGRSAADIASAMTAFRTGAREATVMDRIAKGFSDQETAAIADWLAREGAFK